MIAVITPSRGRTSLTKTIQSVKEQTYEGRLLHYVISDGAGPIEVAETGGNRAVKVVERKKRGGPGAARNTGIRMAIKEGAKYIGFIDDDDIWHPDFVAILAQSMDDYDMTYADLKGLITNADGSYQERVMWSKDWGGWGSLRKENYIPLPACLFRADFFTKYGMFREDIGKCFPIGSPVLTDEGYKSIESINPGDSVLTHTGAYNKVIKVFNNGLSSDVYRVVLQGGDSLRATGRHELLTWTAPYGRHGGKGGRYKTPRIQWKHTEDLEINDWVLFPVKDGHLKTYRRIVDDIPLSEEFLEVCGWYLAEGSTEYGKVCFGLSNEEQHIAEYIQVVLKGLLGITVSISKITSTSGLLVRAYSVTLQRWMENNFGKLCDRKFIPRWVTSLPDNEKRALIKGLWLGDGHLDKTGKRSTFVTTSRSMAYGLRELLATLNIHVPYIEKRKPREANRKNAFVLYMYREHNDFIRDLVAGNCAVAYEPDLRSHTFVTIDKVKYIKTRVKYVERLGVHVPVYDIMVEDAHSYVVGQVVVHNCVDWALLAWGEAEGAKYLHVPRVLGEYTWNFKAKDGISSSDPENCFPATTWARIRTICDGYFI